MANGDKPNPKQAMNDFLKGGSHPIYNRELAKGYKEGGLTSTKDRTSPHYSGLDRDVTKRGMDPFSSEAYKPNRAIQRRIGTSERFDDQIHSTHEDEARVAKAKSDKDIQKVASGESLRGSFKRGGRVKRTGVYKLHKGEKVLTAKKARLHG